MSLRVRGSGSRQAPPANVIMPRHSVRGPLSFAIYLMLIGFSKAGSNCRIGILQRIVRSIFTLIPISVGVSITSPLLLVCLVSPSN